MKKPLFIFALAVSAMTGRADDQQGRWLVPDATSIPQLWQYTVDKPQAEWQQLDFDCASWSRGLGGFGTSAVVGLTAETAWQSGDIWLRKTFAYDGQTYQAASLHIFYDDDVEVYLNGGLVFEKKGYVGSYRYFAVDEGVRKNIRTGNNVLAVHCRQKKGGQFIDVGLILDGPDEYPSRFKVTSQEMTATPVSELLYSNFIELGYGLQVEAMWAEMLFNRSFEAFFAYRPINITWFDLWLEKNNPKKGYKTDWSKEDWYHSGYEHNPWFACPGDGGLLPIDNNSTFVVEKSPAADAQIAAQEGGCGHGKHCLKVTNNEPSKWAGAAQAGKLFRKGETYRFRGALKSLKGGRKAEIRVYPKGDWAQPIFVAALDLGADSFGRHSVEFYNGTYEGWGVFSLWIEPGSEILADDFSLMPASAVHGWRPDVIQAAKRIKPGVVRFPGGCFASFYNWRDGIGPQEFRQPQPSYFWGGLNYNDVGVDELASFCKAVGAQMMYCVNIYHPLKQRYDHYYNETMTNAHGRDLPQFADPEQGVKDAADLVAYCNLPAGSHPMADLRARNGYVAPFGIQFWEMDNEVFRWCQPEEYAEHVVRYSKAMKAVDPMIKIGLQTYGGRPERKIQFCEKLADMLQIAGKDVDFLADRRDAEAGMDKLLSVMRDYNAKNGTSIRYCDTEWLALDPGFEQRFEKEVTPCFIFGKWFYALKICKSFLSWQRRGGDVMFVNFNNLANTHSQCVIETPKEGVYLTAAGKVFELLSRSPSAWALTLSGYAPKVADEFQVQSAWDKTRRQLVLSIVNRTEKPRTADFDLAELKRTFRLATVSELSGDGFFAMNSLSQQDAVRRSDRIVEATISTNYVLTVPAYSFTQIVLE